MTALVRYEIGEQIAIGGMGVVYGGFRLDKDGARTPVAFKQLRENLAQDERAAEQFIQEAQLCTMLQHPNIVSGLGLHRDEQGRLLLVMEYVDGIELTALRQVPRISEPAAVYIIRGILQALAYLHKRGIAHCDVSPHNVVIGRDGAVKLMDFGVSRFVHAHGQGERPVRGKPRYMAPEQIRGAVGDARADLYAVGVMLYELLTGQIPFGADAETMNEVLVQVMCGSLVPPRELRPELSPGVESVVLRLLARDADERYATAEAVLDDLPGVDDGSEIIALVRTLAGKPRGAAPEPLHGAFPAPQAADVGEPSRAALGLELEPRPHAAQVQVSAPGRMRGYGGIALAAALGTVVGGPLIAVLSRTGPASSEHGPSKPLPASTVPSAAELLLPGHGQSKPVSTSGASDEQDARSSERAARKRDAERSTGPDGNALPANASRSHHHRATPDKDVTQPWSAAGQGARVRGR